MINKILSAIDIGTNTFRLLIAKVNHDSIHNVYTIDKIYSRREVTRLGDGLHDNGLLTNAAIKMSINVLKEFSAAISDNNVYRTSAIATAALREAGNSEEFLKMAQEETGLEIEVISGEHEARITASGMLMDFHLNSPALLIDIGGGSTELMLLGPSNVVHQTSCIEIKGTVINDGLEPLSVHSLKMGVVHLANKYMEQDPPLQRLLNEMGNDITRHISMTLESINRLITKDTILIGTAGTVTALSAICQGLSDFNHDKIHKYNLSVDNVNKLYKTISTISSLDRAELIPFDTARLDIIVPGTLILLTLMNSFNFSNIVVSNHGLREGILIDLFNRLS